MEHWPEYSRFFIALLVILDPFAAIPIVLSLSQDYTAKERNRAAAVAFVTAVAVLSLYAVFGETMLTVLGPIGLNILNRLIGLTVTVIAVEIMTNGLRDLFTILAG